MASTVVPRETLSYAAARARVLAAVRPLAAETIPLEQACGRALRETVRAPHDLPPFDNSSMDGYALRARDLASARPDRPVELEVVGEVPAGRVAPRALGAGQAMRIMTGAQIPDGADAIVRLEDVAEPERGTPALGRQRFTQPVTPGANVRAAGRDVRTGEVVLEAGRDLSAHDIALLAGLGIARIAAGPRPTAAVISTGDELLAVEEALRPGAIRDSNSILLGLLLEEAGCRVVSSERVGDDAAALVARVRRATDSADVVLTIGGVSLGDHDPVKQGLAAIGDVQWWRVAMKPGQPQAFGVPSGRLFFGLPGNPASVACVFEVLVRPALRALQGFAALDRPLLRVRSACAIASRPGRRDYVRATLAWRGGEAWAEPAGDQVSGHLTPQSRAHALLIVPEEVPALAPGDTAEALVLRWPEPSDR